MSGEGGELIEPKKQEQGVGKQWETLEQAMCLPFSAERVRLGVIWNAR